MRAGVLAATGAAFLAGLATGASAMGIVRDSLQDVQARSTAAVLAEVDVAAEHLEGDMWRVLVLRARPVKTVYGDAAAAGGLLDCRYAEGLPHRRGGRTVSPRVSGSGMEWRVRRGDRVILLLGAAPQPGPACRVLRIEPADREAAISVQAPAARPRAR